MRASRDKNVDLAGPGRYVLTSCRGTQLANDATIENGSSYFTQNLVEALVDASSDQDDDGFVSYRSGEWTATATCDWPGATRGLRRQAPPALPHR